MLVNWMVDGALNSAVFSSVTCCMKLMSYDSVYRIYSVEKREAGT